MPFSEIYHRQVQLLVRTLPLVAQEECFALKGGTAINLFYRNLPRLSVDIDLTYLPLADRAQSLAGIDAALRRIGERIRESDPRIRVQESAPGSQTEITRLVVRTLDGVQIKIEVTPVLRGVV
ncbi:MAG: nucleotidyl transferase AbiEii/AbiGii toxin family protein, partial [Spiribacter salinus]